MTDVTHTNDTTVTSFEYNLKCRNFYDTEFLQKATTRLCFPLFFKICIIPYLFCSLLFFQHADVHATACWRIGSYAPDCYNSVRFFLLHSSLARYSTVRDIAG